MSVFHRPLKISVVLLMIAGAALAVTGAIAAFSHLQRANATAFVAVAVVLVTAAVLIVRGVRWVVAVVFVVLAGQLAAIGGTVWELTQGIAEVKEKQLRSLGFDPTTSVLINLVYSSIGFGLLCWLAVRWWLQRRQQSDRIREIMSVGQVAVCGPRQCTDQDERNAYEVGQLLARAGVAVMCGGGTGVMAAVSAGVKSENGLVIGIRPGDSAADANPDLSAVVVTNLGEARNAVIVWSADAVIAIGGSWGTLSEVALAKSRGGIPVVTLGGWTVLQADGTPLPDPTTSAATPAEAVELALRGVSDR